MKVILYLFREFSRKGRGGEGGKNPGKVWNVKVCEKMQDVFLSPMMNFRNPEYLFPEI